MLIVVVVVTVVPAGLKVSSCDRVRTVVGPGARGVIGAGEVDAEESESWTCAEPTPGRSRAAQGSMSSCEWSTGPL